jgi:regulator of cell morphogenesis and NO signaling
MTTTQTSLADLARTYPGGTMILHRFGLDFCCGGGRSLEAACLAKGIDPADVLATLESSGLDDDGVALHLDLWDVDLLVRYIEQNHHAFLRQLLPTLQQQVAKVVTKHGERYPEIHAIAELVDDLAESLDTHMRDEETGIFSTVRAGGLQAGANDEVQRHEADHEAVGRKLDQLRMLTNDFTPPEGACNTHRSVYALLDRLVTDTMQHIFLENAVLFPKLTNTTSTH